MKTLQRDFQDSLPRKQHESLGELSDSLMGLLGYDINSPGLPIKKVLLTDAYTLSIANS